ncbi:myocardin-related transcription factor A-like isoform X2 [Kryptolebias marmoratus]|uniref:myocardin-related transcription factor A-like isoform X2 n=1 Tax=Kryptolebias marmoratus TaxID=37003 RepID=UPI0018ACA414|nr:myocardin-related transcription factor A-like isoform X2 [Kryptolebias marmoratus]
MQKVIFCSLIISHHDGPVFPSNNCRSDSNQWLLRDVTFSISFSLPCENQKPFVLALPFQLNTRNRKLLVCVFILRVVDFPLFCVTQPLSQRQPQVSAAALWVEINLSTEPSFLQLKLQQRRTREELISLGIMPPLKSTAAFHKQRRSLEQARTEDDLKRKIRSEPEKSKLMKMHISDKMPEEPLLQTKQLQLKKALFDDLNNKIAHWPGPMELIHKKIITGTQLQKASRESLSYDEDSNDSLSPGQPVSQNCPLVLGPRSYSIEKMCGSHIPSPSQVPPSALPFQSVSSTPLNLSKPAQKTSPISHIKPKLNSDRLTQKYKKAKDTKPKLKKLKYHQYIPPNQKGDKEPPSNLDSSYSKILQQQLFLQLQILSQQQQNTYQTIPSTSPKDQKPSSSSTSTSSPPQPTDVSSSVLSNRHNYICLSSAPLRETLPSQPNLDGMKVAQLKSELKLRGLPVSGTRKDLIKRLRTHQELNRGSDTASSPTTGGTAEPGPERAGKALKNTNSYSNNTSQGQQFQHHLTSSVDGSCFSATSATLQRFLRHGGDTKLHIPQCNSLDTTSLKSSNSSPFGEQMNPPLTELSPPSSVAQLPANIKEEPLCSTPPPCQFSLKSASAAPTAPTAAPSVDKDRMLQEKDKQIAELTRMLRQKQRLVEELKMLLEKGNRDAQVPEPQIPLRVKEEPPDNFDVARSTRSPPLSAQTPSAVTDGTKVTIKQEAIETEIGSSEAFVKPSNGLQRSLTKIKVVQNQIRLQLKPKTKSLTNKRELVCLQGSALQLVQQQAIQKLLLQQKHSQKPETQQKLCQQRQKKTQNQQLRQQEQQRQLSQPEHHQQTQQIRLKQQKQNQTKLQHIQLQTDVHPKHQQAQNGAHQVTVERLQQGAAQCLSAPPRLQSAHTGKNTSSPSPQTEMCPHLDVLLSPLSPERVNEEDFITIILQTGETIFRLPLDPPLDHPSPDFSPPSSPPSPLQFPMSPPDPPSCDTQKLDPLEPLAPADTAEEKQHLSRSADGRLEDFLESTTGKPLLGVEPGGMLTLIDDLHSQLLCTPSIVDNPSAPMGEEEELGVDSTDWLGLAMGGEKEEERATLAPLAPETPLSVFSFSADFLDSSDLHTHWDSSL